VGHRLLQIDVNAAPHRLQRRERVLVVGRGDDHRVQLSRHGVVQPPVVGERPDLGGVAGRVGLAGLDERLRDLARVGVHQRDHRSSRSAGMCEPAPLMPQPMTATRRRSREVAAARVPAHPPSAAPPRRPPPP
jgi:hypothetical protein